jgi:hypothetical protein
MLTALSQIRINYSLFTKYYSLITVSFVCAASRRFRIAYTVLRYAYSYALRTTHHA